MTSQHKVILVIEDERPLLEAIRLKLSINNFDVITAQKVAEAQAHLISGRHVDAIWLDHYLLGKEDGLDFLAWCKEYDGGQCETVPIFVVSNTASAETVTTYMRLGAKEYFVKSNHRLDEIINAIAAYVQGDKK